MYKKNLNVSKDQKKRILTACIGQCVHVAGVYNFIKIAENLGYDCNFLGPATPILTIIKEIKMYKPNIVGLSYRLTAFTVKHLLQEFFERFDKLEIKPEKLYFAGTPKVVNEVKQLGRFDGYFIGGESNQLIISRLKHLNSSKKNYPQELMDLISRIEWKKPYPLLRAHFGLSNLNDTIKGVKKLAETQELDVISIAPDQNTQENYFHPEDQFDELSGAGGVPLRSKADFEKLHRARLAGNKPLLRIYAGTRDFIKLAKLFNKTIQNAWAAIPLFWFNQMDGRGPLPLKESIKQHLKAIKWHGDRNIPVEINDPHHWSLRNAPDAIAVADMYLCGIIAKKLNVKHFIAQYMFNTPSSLSFEMDLAKMLAKNELLQNLTDNSFKIIKQVRTGLSSFPLDLQRAKGQLAASTLIQLALKPEIVHVVSFSEADHAALPSDIIESCKIVNQVINRSYSSNLSFIDEKVIQRKKELIEQAKWIINLIPKLAKKREEKENPFINFKVLNRIVKYGIFDAPHLKNNEFGKGEICTKVIEGGFNSIDKLTGKSIDEVQRIETIIYEDQRLSFLREKLSKPITSKEVINL